MLSLLLALAAPAGQDFTWNEVVPNGTTIEVQGVIGSIVATGVGGREVRVTARRIAGDGGDPAEVEIRVIREGARIVFCAIYPRNARWNHGDDDASEERDPCRAARHRAPETEDGNRTRIDFTVEVPAGINFIGETVTDDVSIQGIRGGAEGYTVAGNVSIRDVEGPVVDAATLSGDIQLERTRSPRAYAGTMSGDVTYTGSIQPDGEYSFHSHSGDVEVVLAGRAGVALAVYARRRNVQSAVALEPVPSASGKRSRGTRRGTGSARVSVTSFGGDVVIRDLERVAN